ncbi:SPOR domain-containing protein [Elizabethkingia meningoseptica]|uniref:SPOR domain-containing protein n=1 Tax=Elizabethkingia meningoseptica TaxID=238 RepID=UPI0023AF3204|nr:SPOR domain-containing protein [Elizabethkingia meningoseptica]MDE5520774.1 SPOR domain-containing protein [Elizabethkingia meningoseptica]
MKKIFQIGLIAGLLFFQNVYAQKIISKTDSINGNTYSTQMDSRISDLLIKAEESCNRTSGPKVVNNGGGIIVNNDEKPVSVPRTINTKSLSTADICRNRPKLSGYKIQVAVTNNGNDANKIRYEVRQSFPDLRTELDSSLRPNYKILAGSYFSKQSGGEDLRRVRRVYGSAVLIPYRIFCAEAK